MRDSRCGLAVLACGSSAGLERLARGDATVAAMHWLDAATGEYNVPLVRQALPGDRTSSCIEWAKRVAGTAARAGNPLQHQVARRPREEEARAIAPRQPEAGSQRLFLHLLDARRHRTRDAALARATARCRRPTSRRQSTTASADAGCRIEAAARAHGLAFIPLATERLDLVLRRRDYFEPPLQTLLAFARTRGIRRASAALGGYDVAGTGRVVFNA